MQEIKDFFTPPRVLANLDPELDLISRLVYYGIFYAIGMTANHRLMMILTN